MDKDNLNLHHNELTRLALLEQAINFIKNELKRLEERIDKPPI